MNSPADERSLIFGHNQDAGLVALEHVTGEGADHLRLFFRHDGKTIERDEPFRPFLWLQESAHLAGLPAKAEITELAGANPLKYLARFNCWKDYETAVRALKTTTQRSAYDAGAPYFFLNDPVQQHLLSTGRTLFKGLSFRALKRLQLDIETYTGAGYEFPNAERESDRIVAIAMSDQSGWTLVLSGAELDEKTMLERWVGILRERDPDVIEGHNIFKFDLPYLISRSKRHKVKLNLGRDGSKPYIRSSRYVVAEQVVAYPRAEIFGRHVVDTYFMAQAYDVTHRSLESLTLKDVATHFGAAAPNRTYLDGADIARTFDTDPGRLMQYARDDILETRAVSDVLSPSYFTQAQILPFSYQNICVRGTGAKIDSLLLREYFRVGHSVPIPGAPRAFEGGYTDIFFTGVKRNVHHCDIRSLYPSLMLKDQLGPRTDELSVFLTLLRYLRDFRLDAKKRMQSAAADERNHLDALQTTFKILINSFYGYLGFSQGRFNDYDAAEQVTSEGRAQLKRMIDWLREHSALPIEIDTDGIYFVPPEFKDASAAQHFRTSMQASLPEGLDVEFDGEYVAMFSYKMKNYALLDAQGEVTIKGAALKSRGLEPFQRDYLRQWLRLTLEEKPDEIERLGKSARAAIENRQWPIALLAKTETLQDAPATYAAKIGDKARGRNAAYELAIKSGRDYRAGDQVSHYVTGTKKTVAVHEAAKLVSEWDPNQRDENVPYYLAKLDALIRKFDAMDTDEDSGQTELSLS